MFYRRMSAPSQLARQQVRLIESALPALPPMQRHGDDGVELFVAVERQRQVSSQWLGQRLHPAVFEKMNQIPKRALIESERVRRIEPPHAAPAQRATALLIQRKSASKRSPALLAKIFRRQRFGFREARAANRYARNFHERCGADMALVG